ncbi:hypothetical protein IGI04_039216, partial [Brassica rapa subsp. trilocularis]
PPGPVESLSSDEAIDQDECAPSCEDSPASGALSAQASPSVDVSSDLSDPAESETLASVTVISVTTPGQSNLDASTVKTTSASDLPAESTVPAKETYKEECGGSRSNLTRRDGTPVGLITSDKSSNGVQTDSSDLDSSEAEAERSENEVILHAHLTTVDPPVATSSADKFFWTVDETRDHILLTCGYSSEIWRYILPRLESPDVCFMNWTELLSWIKAPARGNFCTLKKIVTQSTLYHIWRQRNNILHNQVLIPPDTVFRIIDRDVRNILLGRRGRRAYNTLLSSWLKFE